VDVEITETIISSSVNDSTIDAALTAPLISVDASGDIILADVTQSSISVSISNPVVNADVTQSSIQVNLNESVNTSWGDITGTLSDQADLQAALNAKADDSDLVNKLDIDGGNANTDVDLGAYGLTASKLTAAVTYSGTSFIQTAAANLTVNTAASNDTFDYIGNYITIADTHATSGVIEDGSISRYCYVASFNRNADSSVDWQDGGELMTGYSMNMTRGGAFTGEGHPIEMVGYNLIMNNEVSYNNPSGNYTQDLYGSKMIVQSNGSVVAGSVTKTMFGQYYAFSMGGAPAATALYANYLATMAGADVMYYLYCTPDVPSYLAGDLGLGVTVPTAKLDIAASTTAKASMRLRAGTAPTSPNEGDIYFSGTHFYGRVGGVWKQLDN
jgi:hypothetical protein